MAIAKGTDTDQELQLIFSNGDLAAIKEVKQKWKFRNLEDIIRFALAVMVKADNTSIVITQGGSPKTLSPANELLEPQNPPINPQQNT